MDVAASLSAMKSQMVDFVVVKTKRGPAVELEPGLAQSAHADW
jgi:hypothetical protein